MKLWPEYDPNVFQPAGWTTSGNLRHAEVQQSNQTPSHATLDASGVELGQGESVVGNTHTHRNGPPSGGDANGAHELQQSTGRPAIVGVVKANDRAALLVVTETTEAQVSFGSHESISTVSERGAIREQAQNYEARAGGYFYEINLNSGDVWRPATGATDPSRSMIIFDVGEM